MRRRTTISIIALSVGLLFAAVSAWYFHRALPIFLGFAAKTICSGVFVSGRSAKDVLQKDVAPVVFFSRTIRVNEDPADKTVAASLAGYFAKQALYRNGCGCTLLPTPASRYTIHRSPVDFEDRTPDLPEDVSWPLGTATDFDTIPIGVDRERLQAAVSDAFTEPVTGTSRQTRAVVVVYRGRLIAERYAEGFDRSMPLAGWSMSKSVINALVGILVYKGKLNLYDPAPVPEWQAAGDPRNDITLDQLLRMTSGLRFREVYTPPSDVTEMLFQRHDFGAAAASKPLEAAPGDNWHYSSGTSNIIARIIRRAVEPDYGHSVSFVRRELFNRLGMRSAIVELDPSGTIVGSSYTFATARDWARFGLLYLQDGIWQGRRILPPGWVDYSRKPSPPAPQGQYGAHFWLNAGDAENTRRRRWPALPTDMLVAWGFQGQFLVIIPSKDLVLVRLGLNKKPEDWNLERFVSGVTAALH
jgi:CubicO group peptidase (beta-lactamase class C family)